MQLIALIVRALQLIALIALINRAIARYYLLLQGRTTMTTPFGGFYT
jgi:hypothetical protein